MATKSHSIKTKYNKFKLQINYILIYLHLNLLKFYQINLFIQQSFIKFKKNKLFYELIIILIYSNNIRYH